MLTTRPTEHPHTAFLHHDIDTEVYEEQLQSRILPILSRDQNVTGLTILGQLTEIEFLSQYRVSIERALLADDQRRIVKLFSLRESVNTIESRQSVALTRRT